MGGVLSCCTRRKSPAVEPEGVLLEEMNSFGDEKNERRRMTSQHHTPLLDPQTFEFVDAVHLPLENAHSGSNLETPMRRPSKRNSLTAWLAGGLFSRSPSAGSPSHASSGAHSGARNESRKRSGSLAQQPVKILMSGAGESGKSTVIKQMKIIHQGGFTSEELYDFKPQIYRNIHDSMMQIIETMDGTELSRDDATLESVWRVKRFKAVYEDLKGLPTEYIEAINHLWLELIRNNFDSISRKVYILDSAPYFFEEINRIGMSGYSPTNEDVLRARITTTGINEYSFKSHPLHIRMIDVGGQRPERRKWIETFDNVTTLIFCVAISEYDQMLREEPRQNRLLEAFQLWESVINSKWFQRSTVVLFLNKKDIFRHKLRINPLARYFPDYRPPAEGTAEEMVYLHAVEFIKGKFLAMNYGRVQIYTFVTCATDTLNIHGAFEVIKETILANNLKNAGIM